MEQVFQDYHDSGLVSVYLWGSIISSDFSSKSSDVDAVGILADKASFKKMDQMREWLPKLDPKLKRLQINFFYLSELKKTGPVRSRLARLQDAEQAVFDFPYWVHICGRIFSPTDFPQITPEQVLRHQIVLSKTKMQWALNPDDYYGDMGLQYCCKGLAWLCYGIHKLSNPAGPFSWSVLEKETTRDTKSLVEALVILKSQDWDPINIKRELTFLLNQAEKLISKYNLV